MTQSFYLSFIALFMFIAAYSHVASADFSVTDGALYSVAPDSEKMIDPESSRRFEIKGLTTGYPHLKQDGFINFSLILPALERKQIYDFNASAILSSEMDTITAAGQQLNIPSNISLPRQKEKYNFLITLTFDKPKYRLIVEGKKAYEIAALHGRFPFKTVINELRADKSLFEVINHFEFLSMGERSTLVSADMDKQDISIDQWKLRPALKTVAPAFNAGTHSVISVSLLEANGLLFPTDVKGPNPNQNIALSTHNQSGKPFILSARVSKSAVKGFNLPKFDPHTFKLLPSSNPTIKSSMDFSKLSLNILPYSAGATSRFLSDVPSPIINGDTLSFTPPTPQTGLNPLVTHAQLVEVKRVNNGSYETLIRTPLWRSTNKGWISDLDISNLPVAIDPGKTYRWEVIYTASNQIDGPLTHLTKNFLEF